MRFKCSYLLLISIFIYPIFVFAQGQYTKFDNLKIYSEYYPNTQAKFKGSILFENGSGNSLEEWTENSSFFQCAKQYGNLFMYDRSGLGKSSPDLSMSIQKPMTAELINFKLMKLLKLNNIKPPYILVAHSYGGRYAAYFARKYPELVAGVLMVDPVPYDYQWSDAFLKKHQAQMKTMSKLSSKEIYNKFKQEKGSTSPELFYQLKGFEQTMRQISSLPPFSNNIPIIIVSSSYMERNAPIKGDWYQLQQQWLNNNPNSKIIKVNSGHFIQENRPEVICEQIRALAVLASD